MTRFSKFFAGFVAVLGLLVATGVRAAPEPIRSQPARSASTAVAETSAASEADTTVPTVRLTGPTAGTALTAFATLSASARDASGITQVVFQIRGDRSDAWTTLGREWTAPYGRRFDLSGFPDGDYALRAVATDDAGNTAESAPVAVSVAPTTPVATAEEPYRITRSGRPRGSGDSTVAYDGDPETTWATDAPSTKSYAWFDLGASKPLASVRWVQAAAGGAVQVQVSRDRERWTPVGQLDEVPSGTWQSVAVDDSARFVLFIFTAQAADAPLGHLAEVEIYGPPGADVGAAADAADRSTTAARPSTAARATTAARSSTTARASGAAAPAERAAPRRTTTRPVAPARQTRHRTARVATTPAVAAATMPDAAPAAARAAAVSAEPDGVIRVGGEVVTEVNCDDVRDENGTFTCDVHADGGTATCDEAGGDRNRGQRAGNGGTCTKDASGGTVDIGDINP